MSQSAYLLNSFNVNHVIIIFGTEVVFVFLSLSNQIKAFGRVTLCPFLLHQLFNSGLSNMKLYERLETESTYPYTHPYSNDSFCPRRVLAQRSEPEEAI